MSATSLYFRIALLLSLALNVILLSDRYRPEIRDILASYQHPIAITPLDHIRGDSSAAVTVIDYADFQCPFCRQLYTELQTLQPEMHFRWIYRQYPLDIHDHAELYSEVSECAAEQRRFWVIADALTSYPPTVDTFNGIASWANTYGVNPDALTDCLIHHRMSAKVEEERAEGAALLIAGTPTFFINGKRYVGSVTESQLRTLLAAASQPGNLSVSNSNKVTHAFPPSASSFGHISK